jgi:hypothetical protein
MYIATGWLVRGATDAVGVGSGLVAGGVVSTSVSSHPAATAHRSTASIIKIAQYIFILVFFQLRLIVAYGYTGVNPPVMNLRDCTLLPQIFKSPASSENF